MVYGELVVGGNGVSVTGTGTKADPYRVGIDFAELDLGSTLTVASSSTVEFGKTGDQTNVRLAADVVVRSPSGARWTLAVSDGGDLTAVAAGPARTGGTLADGTVTGVVLFWDPVAQLWDTRTNADKVLWSSVGSSGAPIPPGFKRGDVWFKAAS